MQKEFMQWCWQMFVYMCICEVFFMLVFMCVWHLLVDITTLEVLLWLNFILVGEHPHLIVSNQEPYMEVYEGQKKVSQHRFKVINPG